mmetsp:Transcript_41829/g.129001  ORF Transcript_41829/g.129001 Transcript_41829/m.129001 type:complete len:579 (+) Transcript_41829:54-1790(+)
MWSAEVRGVERGDLLPPRARPQLRESAESDVGAQQAEEAPEREEEQPLSRRPHAARPRAAGGAVDQGGEDVDDGGAEEGSRDADRHGDVGEGERESGGGAEKREDERRVVGLGGDCAGDAREPARQRGGERDAEASQRVIQPLEGERVADEDRDAGGSARADGELVRGREVVEQVGGGCLAEERVPGAHHRRVQRREQPEGVDAALCPPPLRPLAQRRVEGGHVVVRAEGEAQVGEERRRGRIHLPRACALEAGREVVRQGGEQRRAAARRVRPVECASDDDGGGGEDSARADSRGEGEAGQVFDQAEGREHRGGERQQDAAAQEAAGGGGCGGEGGGEEGGEEVADDGRVDERRQEAHEHDCAVDHPRCSLPEGGAPEVLEGVGADGLARGADEVEGVPGDRADAHHRRERRHPPHASHAIRQRQHARAGDVVEDVEDGVEDGGAALRGGEVLRERALRRRARQLLLERHHLVRDHLLRQLDSALARRCGPLKAVRREHNAGLHGDPVGREHDRVSQERVHRLRQQAVCRINQPVSLRLRLDLLVRSARGEGSRRHPAEGRPPRCRGAQAMGGREAE